MLLLPPLLLLLLLLLTRVQHPPFCQSDRLAQHLEITDVVGENEHQRSIKIGALGLVQAAMRLDDGTERVIGRAFARPVGSQ